MQAGSAAGSDGLKARVLLIAAAAALLLVVVATALAAGDREIMTERVVVKGVEVRLLPSYPAQVQLVVELRKAPDAAVAVEQRRDGQNITVVITQARSVSVREPVSTREIVMLRGGFDAGTYRVSVNEYSTTFDVK